MWLVATVLDRPAPGSVLLTTTPPEESVGFFPAGLHRAFMH